jgi:hypothetical protein
MFYPKDPVIYDELVDVILGVASVDKGDPAVIQDVFGFYLVDALITETPVFIYRMRQVVADKVQGTGEEIEAGDRVYYVVASGLVTANPTGAIGTNYYFCGWCKKAAEADDDTVLINFDGTVYNNADMA